MSQDTGIKTEHEPVDRSQAEEVYNPSPEEQRTAAMVKKLFQRAKKHRAKYDQDWMDNYRMFRGKQWTEQRPAYRHSEVLNLVFTNIQSQTSLMSDSKPKTSFTPQDPTDLEFSNIINDVNESDWDRNAWLMPLCEVILDSHIYGIGYSETCYSQELDLGQGSVTYQSVDPLECYPDPDAIQINDRTGEDKSSFFIRAQPYNVDKLKAKYPEKAPYIKADLHELWNDERTDIRRHRWRSPTDNRIIEGQGQRLPENDMALLITCWVKDNTIVEEMVKSLDDQGNETTEYEQRKKYPRGRKVVMVGEVILEDGENPYEDGEFPYEKHVNYMLSREYYGISEVENLKSPQKIFNKIYSFILDIMTLMGNPIWIVPTSSGVDTDTLTNRPGMIVEPDNVNHGIQRQEGVQLQPYIMNMLEEVHKLFDTVGGSQDVTRGVNPTGVSAASAISQLQDAAQTRIRQKMRNLDAYLKPVGRHWLSRVLQFYSVQRVYRVTNNEDGSQKYFKMSIVPKEDGSKVARVIEYTKAGDLNLPQPMREVPMQAQAQFDVQCSTGSALPFAKAEKEQRLYALFDREIIDAEEVLSGLDYPNGKAVQERMAQAAAQQAQQQPANKAAG